MKSLPVKSLPVAIIVMAKAPVPGKVKTRLCPPCTPEEAAALAAAALADTLDAVAAVPARRHILAVDGALDLSIPTAFETIDQRGTGLDERLAAAFDDVGGPALLVGMDTPQVAAPALVEAIKTLLRPGTDSVLGPAPDGGWWAAGLRRADRRAFVGVPMSTPSTGLEQWNRFTSLGLQTQALPLLRDVDEIADALAVAAAAPGSRFAAQMGRLELDRIDRIAV